MSNPIYDMMKQMETQKDIAEISAILSGYENANGRNKALDTQASEKIREMQGKDLAIYAVTAPKPGTPGIPWSEVPPTQLYNSRLTQPSTIFIGASCGIRIISFISTIRNLPRIWLMTIGCH